MKKLYYISILASLMASQSNFAATETEEKFLLTFIVKYPQNILQSVSFISNKIKKSDIEAIKDVNIYYCAAGQGALSTKADIDSSDGIFGNPFDFNQADKTTIFTKEEIVPFIDRFLGNDVKTLFDSDIHNLYKEQHFIDYIKNKPVKIIYTSNDGTLTEDFKTFKKRNPSTQNPLNQGSNPPKKRSTSTQRPLNQDTNKLNTPTTPTQIQNPSNQGLNPSEETNPSTQNSLNQETNKPTTTNPSTQSPLNPSTSTESLWSGYQKPILAIIALAVLLGILYYMEVFSTLSSNNKKPK